jgi:hypothetical protein
VNILKKLALKLKIESCKWIAFQAAKVVTLISRGVSKDA